MAFRVSPFIEINERDQTLFVASDVGQFGAYVGDFGWGPVEERVLVSQERELRDQFGAPTPTQSVSFHIAAAFLAYDSSLYVTRVVGTGASNAVGYDYIGTGSSSVSSNYDETVLIKNEDDYENTTSYPAPVTFAARYPGAIGNSLKVSICDANGFATWAYADSFNDTPGTSDYVAAQGGSNDELHVIVIDEGGLITGTANTVLEKFQFVSKASDSVNADGSSNYYKKVLELSSDFIYSINDPVDVSNWSTAANGVTFDDLLGGVLTLSFEDGADVAAADGDLQTGWDLYVDDEVVDVSFLITGDVSKTVAKYVQESVAEIRRDCMVFISPERDDVVNTSDEANNVLDYIRETSGFNSSSYVVFDDNWKRTLDRYNNEYIWIPCNADTAGITAQTWADFNPWLSPAGTNRGFYKGVNKLAWNSTRAQRDTLYAKGINSVIQILGQGTVLWGDKTGLVKESAFSRINVRGLFITVEKNIASFAKNLMFEFNDEFTRSIFVNRVDAYLTQVEADRGLIDFRVVADETNNTDQVIANNEFIGDIYIQPNRSINYIKLNFTAVNDFVSFDEIVGG